jgi:anti-anti-sigma factor
MKIVTLPKPGRFEMQVTGRLDAAWADHFLDAVRHAVREGHHHVRIDARGLDYMSSAGLRSLLLAHRELTAVNGSFAFAAASEFVIETLRLSGFDSLLAIEEAAPAAAEPADGRRTWTGGGATLDVYDLEPGATLRGERFGGWTPWRPVAAASCHNTEFGDAHLGLGVGAPGHDFADVRERLGEFLAVAGCAAFLPGDGTDVPDFLVGAERFVPRLIVADALRAEGSWSHLLRFQPAGDGAPLDFATLLDAVLAVTGEGTAAFVLLAEIDGLVGVSLTRSPGLIDGTTSPAEWPQIRDWLSFCGERVHTGAQALVTGFVSAADDPALVGALPPLPSRPGRRGHAHAAVFPYRPLPNGRIELAPAVRQVFGAAEPVALLHLLEDPRPALGLGQSAFVRGACWCAPVAFQKESHS